MRVLIVGYGYVGQALGAELLQRGHEVFGLSRSQPDEAQTHEVKPLRADVTRLETLARLPRNFDWVVNCAASGGGDAADYRELYLTGNRNLVTWLAPAPPRKFVYTSSTSVYAQDDGSVVTEQSPTEPESETAKVLLSAENVLLAAVRNHFPAVILRAAGIYGPGRGHAFKQFLRGEARTEGDGSRHMNMIHRDDLAGIIMSALEQGAPGEIYNAVDDEPVAQLKFFEWLAAELKRPLPPPAGAGQPIGRKRGVTDKRVSNAKLHAALNYEFRYPNFRNGYAAEISRLASSRPAVPAPSAGA